MCHLYKETPTHFPTCKYYTKTTEQQNTQLIQVFQKVQLDPYLRILLQRALHRQSCAASDILKSHLLFPLNDYKQLLLSQDRIGWLNILKGYLSVQWDRHQLRYTQEQDLKPKPGDENWLTKVFVYIHQQTYSCWQQRNNKLHSTESEYVKMSLLQRIKGFYAVKQDLSIQDHQPFYVPIQAWKYKTSSEMSKWLLTHSEYIKLCLKREKQRKKNRLQDLRY